MSKIVSVGSLTLDLFFQDKSLTIKKNRFNLALGGKYVTEYFNQGIGGGGGNIAVGLSRIGIETALWSQIGQGGVSSLIESRLLEENIIIDSLEFIPDLNNISVILLSEKGERTIINHRSHKSELDFNSVVKKLIKNSQGLYLGNLPELSLNLRQEILGYAKSHGLTTFLNLGVKDCRFRLKVLKKLIEQVDYLVLNRYELSDILNINPQELMPNIINYQSQIFDNNRAVLIITDGEFGSYAQSDKETIYQTAYKVPKVVDSTGAGDAFTSAFISGITLGYPLKLCLRAGAKNSASVIAKINAQDGLLAKDKLFQE